MKLLAPPAAVPSEFPNNKEEPKMINAVPVIGWFFSVLAAFGLSVPFWICWTVCHIGTKYFSFLPERYQSIPFWDCVGLFIVLGVIGGIIKMLSPFVINQSYENKTKS